MSPGGAALAVDTTSAPAVNTAATVPPAISVILSRLKKFIPFLPFRCLEPLPIVGRANSLQRGAGCLPDRLDDQPGGQDLWQNHRVAARGWIYQVKWNPGAT